MQVRIKIKRDVWDEVIKAAREVKERGEKIRAFFLYSKRGNPLLVVRAKEVPVRVIKESSSSGMIFRWAYPKDKYREYYPRRGPDRYSGTLLIKSDLSMTLHYAYWMGLIFRAVVEGLILICGLTMRATQFIGPSMYTGIRQMGSLLKSQ